MNYKISRKSANSKFLFIEVHFKNTNKSIQEVHLPSWRPGRYEIQNFAKYIKNLKAKNQQGKPLNFYKIKKDVWLIESKNENQFTIEYEFYADLQNAGGSYVQNDFFYLNPINCCLYIEEQQEENCVLEVDFQNNNDVACGMEHEKRDSKTIFTASSFHDLVDSPIMISSKIQHNSFKIDQHTFHIWIKGKVDIPWTNLFRDFKKFTKYQIGIFGSFPEPEYHFMLWMMPQAFYHGVEHRNSTMMTLGPDAQDFKEYYSDLLGLASHELFHTWNVKRIRPKELLPYDYSKENYFETCFVAEGLTTFYGDWTLYKSGVFDKSQYQKELETTLKRHFETADLASQSLLESSYDLWLDGYQKGIPNRKVSVYHKGALAALILDYLIRTKTKNRKSLDDVLKSLWQQHGETNIGYSLADYKKICEQAAESSLHNYFCDIIEGNESIKEQTQECLKSLGFEMKNDTNGIIRLLSLTDSKP